MTSARQTGGYVRAYRRRWEHPLFRSKAEAAVWAWLTDCAAFTDHCMATKYGPIDLKRGQILISERSIARDFNLHKNAVRALLSRLDQEHMITRFWDHSRRKAGTIVTIVNYEKFQGPTPHEPSGQDQSAAHDGTAAGPQRDRSGTAAGPRIKKGKKGKKERKQDTRSRVPLSD